MKTTIELNDVLFRDAKALAHQKGVTLRALVEEGLRNILENKKSPNASFQLKDGSFGGDQAAVELPWTEVRKLIYEGRGE